MSINNLVKPEGKLEEKSNVFSIPPGAPFLRTLAEALVDGTLARDTGGGKIELSESLIFLPTRRAARALGVELLEAVQRHSGSNALILPRIRTIGDLENEESLYGLGAENPDVLAHLPDGRMVIEPVERQLVLAELTQKWVQAMSPATRDLLGKEEIALPSSASDALRLAADLARFMDQVETEETDWQLIAKIAPDGFDQWWQLTLDFLKIIMQTWPQYLSEKNLVNPSEFRNRVIDFRISELQRNPPAGLVIAAGTTGSIPATARLLQAIRAMERGRIVLPGLDTSLSPGIIQRFADTNEMTDESVSSTHAQFGLVKLLQKLKTPHGDVCQLGEISLPMQTRTEILNTVMVPAEDSENWILEKERFTGSSIEQAFDKVSLIEAPGEFQEALAISLVLRETLQDGDRTAALITPDRNLARRVSSELERFDIQIDDSAGNPLPASKPAGFLRQILRAATNGNDPVSLSSFLKSDLVCLGEKRHETTLLKEALEIALIRDVIILPGIDDLAQAVKRRQKDTEEKKHVPQLLRKLTSEQWQELETSAAWISNCLKDIHLLFSQSNSMTVAQLALVLRHCGEALSSDADGRTVLYDDAGGEELQSILIAHGADFDTRFEFAPHEAVAVFDAMIAGKRTRKAGRTRPRLQIYGTLEARLQHADVVILAGLNEGIWPQSSRNDPYLNRPMRSELHLPLPERRIGLAAHDFGQFSGAEEVYYTRSRRMGDTPAIASRWLQRLKTFLGEEQSGKLVARGNWYLDLAQSLDEASGPPVSSKRPEPCPPVALRPTSLSFTEIETWIRDPYATYAKHVLKIVPLPPLVREADPALRGTIYHDILAKFVATWRGEITETAGAVMESIADDCFEKQNIPAEIQAGWRPRFTPVGEAFLSWESPRRTSIKASHCEIDMRAEIEKTGFVLRGRADRIDVHHDGGLTVIDYKTGGNPSKKQARTLSPQLSLEGALAARGAAAGIDAAPIANLYYVRLKEGDGFKGDDITKGNGVPKDLTAADLCDTAYENLIKHIIAYQSESQPYVSQYAPLSGRTFAGDYDHLARIREWSLNTAEEDGVEA